MTLEKVWRGEGSDERRYQMKRRGLFSGRGEVAKAQGEANAVAIARKHKQIPALDLSI